MRNLIKMKKPFPKPCEDCGVKIKNRTSNRQKLCRKCFVKRQMAGRARWNKTKPKPNNSATHKTEKKHWKTKKIRMTRFAKCIVCGRKFERNVKRRWGGRGTMRRPMKSITCSKVCSRKWVYSDKRQKEDRSKK